MRKVLLLIVGCLVLAQCQRVPDQLYKDSSASPEDRVEDLLSRMTLEEKVGQLSGMGAASGEFGDFSVSIFGTEGNERLGIPKLVMGHGITGVRSGRDVNINSTYLMAPIGIAATWDMQINNEK